MSALVPVREAICAVASLQTPEALLFLEKGADRLADLFSRGGKLLVCGNGGSWCDAAHFAEELTGFFRGKRPPLPALVLGDSGYLTCVGNDLGFEWVFSRAVAAYAVSGDILMGLTTSGSSANVVRAFEEAKRRQLFTIALLGRGGGVLKGVADLELCIDGFLTSDRVQEAHMAALHILVELVEKRLFGEEQRVHGDLSSCSVVVPS